MVGKATFTTDTSTTTRKLTMVATPRASHAWRVTASWLLTGSWVVFMSKPHGTRPPDSPDRPIRPTADDPSGGPSAGRIWRFLAESEFDFSAGRAFELYC